MSNGVRPHFILAHDVKSIKMDPTNTIRQNNGGVFYTTKIHILSEGGSELELTTFSDRPFEQHPTPEGGTEWVLQIDES